MGVPLFLVLVIFLKSLNDDFLGVDCLVASLYEQLGDFETRGALGLVFGCWLEDAIVTIISDPEWGNYRNNKFYSQKRWE